MNGKNYLTPEQIEKMKSINNSFSEEQKAEMQKQWDRFISNLKQHTENKTPLTDPSVKELALYWKNATATYTGQDSEITMAGERCNPLSNHYNKNILSRRTTVYAFFIGLFIIYF